MDTAISEALPTNTTVEKPASLMESRGSHHGVEPVQRGARLTKKSRNALPLRRNRKNNISTILSKLELRDRTQLQIFAYENKLKQ